MLTSVLGEHPEVRLLEFLANHKEFDYTITEMSRHTGVSRPSAYKVVERFLARGVLERTRKVGASQFYKLNLESPLVKPFLDIELVVLPEENRRPRRRLAARKGVSR